MKRLFAFFVFLSCSTIMWAHSFGSEMAVGDTIENKIYELGPEINEKKFLQKRKAFWQDLCSYLINYHKEDIIEIEDSVIINFEVNAYGRVDSVWLVSSKSYSFENTLKFIKDYDFQGPLMEYLIPEPVLYEYTVKFILVLDKEESRLRMRFYIIDSRVRRLTHLPSSDPFHGVIPLYAVGWDGIRRGHILLDVAILC